MNQAKKLLKKYKAGICSTEELALLQNWFHHLNEMESSSLSDEELLEAHIRLHENMVQLVSDRDSRPLWPRLVAAASIVILFSFGGYLILKHVSPKYDAQISVHDIAPGSNKAIITLANGRKIILNGAKTGLLVKQGNTAVKVKNGGEVVYDEDGVPEKVTRPQYNTLTTPRGGQYPLTLSDGTKVWLDAQSSITYPVAFTGDDRTVRITGQVYFEVKHNAKHPFRVSVKNQLIQDVGTQFNVNAYDDEPLMKTTLVEGSVNINSSTVVKAGQEASIDKYAGIKVTQADVAMAVAWKDGLFRFNQTNLKTLMRQVSRWYDINVVYEGDVANDQFDGKISRDVTLSRLLQMLDANQVHFQIKTDGATKTLIIKP